MIADFTWLLNFVEVELVLNILKCSPCLSSRVWKYRTHKRLLTGVTHLLLKEVYDQSMWKTASQLWIMKKETRPQTPECPSKCD